MRKVKAKNTVPELKLRHLLREMGFRGYRVHYDALPGKPDVVFTKLKKVIFVHGCFWHGHDCRAGQNAPRTNQDYWKPKLARNKERDQYRQEALRGLGWDVLVVWECELRDLERTAQTLRAFLSSVRAFDPYGMI